MGSRLAQGRRWRKWWIGFQNLKALKVMVVMMTPSFSCVVMTLSISFYLAFIYFFTFTSFAKGTTLDAWEHKFMDSYLSSIKLKLLHSCEISFVHAWILMTPRWIHFWIKDSTLLKVQLTLPKTILKVWSYGSQKMCKKLCMWGMLNKDDIKRQVSQNVRCQNGTRVSKHLKSTSNYNKHMKF